MKTFALALTSLLLASCAPSASPESNLLPAQVDALLKRNPKVQLVDVRTQEEWDAGRLKGARHIPLDQLEGRMKELDRSLPVVAYCRSGNRSATALGMLQKAGFKDAAHLKSGILGWAAMGYPVER